MVKTICFVTGNPTKVLHAQTVLKEFGIKVTSKKIDIIEPKEETPEEVVKDKALQAIKVLKTPLMVEDSGIFIESLNGFPKTFVHFAIDTIGVKGILKLVDGVKDRNAEFRQSLAYIEPGMKEPKIFSYVDGGFKLADKIWNKKIKKGSEFDSILIPPGEIKPLASFSRQWRADRDARQNKGKIHYEQLAVWLKSR